MERCLSFVKFATLCRLRRGCVGHGLLSDVISQGACFPCQNTDHHVTDDNLADAGGFNVLLGIFLPPGNADSSFRCSMEYDKRRIDELLVPEARN